MRQIKLLISFFLIILLVVKVLMPSKGPDIVGEWRCYTVDKLGEEGFVIETFRSDGKGKSSGLTLGILPFSRQQDFSFDLASTWAWSMDKSVLTISELKYDVVEFYSPREAKSFVEEKFASLDGTQYVVDVEFPDKNKMILREPQFGITAECNKEVSGYKRLW